ncbi:MAG: aldose epimerase family protein [Erysipelotrichaceae bacterium]|nr:aldose epimerase family protein [Erysipelotrichaceae bacterium]
MKQQIENAYLKIEVSELGATLVKLIEKETDTDLVLGFDDDRGYLDNNGANIGASIGRNSNRIGNGRFELNGKTYQLTINNNMNQLHGGGFNGFGFKMWKLKEAKDDELVYYYDAKDGEEGFPGNCHAEVSYKLQDNNLIITFTGTSDQDTIFNMTNHSYFCLGDDNILDQELYVTSDKYSPTDEYALTLDEVRDVKDTPYDFREFTRIGSQLEKLKDGIDNNYVWENMEDKLMCELKNDKFKLSMYSDLPDMHIYTSYYLDPCTGKYGKQYKRYSGIALECQFYPNGINYSDYIKPILRKGEVSSHYMKIKIDTLK